MLHADVVRTLLGQFERRAAPLRPCTGSEAKGDVVTGGSWSRFALAG